MHTKTRQTISGVSLAALFALGLFFFVPDSAEAPLPPCAAMGESAALTEIEGTTLSFCTLPEWGALSVEETQIDPTMRTGSIWYLSFENMEVPGFLLSYQSKNFEKLGDRSGGPEFNFRAVDFSKTAGEIAEAIQGDENPLNVDVLRLGEKYVLRVRENRVLIDGSIRQAVDYYLPNVLINGKQHDLHIGTIPEYKGVAEQILETLVID